MKKEKILQNKKLYMENLKGGKLLVLGGLALECEIVARAQEMGIYVIVADYNPNVPARKYADRFELISATDVPALVELCKKEKIDGVTTGFIDILMQPCYDVCKELGLPCYFTPKMLSMSTNKVDFKETCTKYGIPVPQTYFIGEQIPDDVYGKVSYPVFVKPLDASGSRGAAICNNKEELNKYFAEAVSYSVTKNALIEDYITGREFLMNFIAQDGEFRMISMFDRYACSDRGGAMNYANLAIGPSKAVNYYLNEVNDKVANMFKSLGFKDGLYFLQGFSNGDKIVFYEMGCRLGGSYYDLEEKCIGIDPVKMTVKYALTGKMTDDIQSMPINIGNYNNIGVCINYLLISGENTIDKITGIKEISDMKSFVKCEQRLFEGDSYNTHRIVDWPIFSVYSAVDNIEQVINDVNYMNSVFGVYNKDGKSLLKEKFNPELLKSLR
jgi:carbamoylphosphate synthase large subunit